MIYKNYIIDTPCAVLVTVHSHPQSQVGTVTPSAIRPNVGGVAAAPIGPAVAVKPEQEDQFGVYEKFVTIFSKNSVHHLHDNVNTKFLWRI